MNIPIPPMDLTALPHPPRYHRDCGARHVECPGRPARRDAVAGAHRPAAPWTAEFSGKTSGCSPKNGDERWLSPAKYLGSEGSAWSEAAKVGSTVNIRKRCVSWLDGIKNLEITSPMGSAYPLIIWTTPNRRWGLQQILSNKDGMLTRKKA